MLSVSSGGVVYMCASSSNLLQFVSLVSKQGVCDDENCMFSSALIRSSNKHGTSEGLCNFSRQSNDGNCSCCSGIAIQWSYLLP